MLFVSQLTNPRSKYVWLHSLSRALCQLSHQPIPLIDVDLMQLVHLLERVPLAYATLLDLFPTSLEPLLRTSSERI
jgi:hypothetical protein